MNNFFRTLLILAFFSGVFFACSTDDDLKPTEVELETKIGQMLMIGFRGMEIGPDDQITKDLIDGRVGGVVLFDLDVALDFAPRNVESPAQVLSLNEQLDFYASLSGDIPLLISVDQEGGRVARLKPDYGFPETVSAEYLGTINNDDTTAYYSSIIANTLADHGFNVNLAPVVDVNINPESPAIGAIGRSFSDDPEVVAHHASIVVDEHRKRNLITTLKHFPGHGSATGDTHYDVTDVTNTWDESELVPYEIMIQLGKADMIMTAHIYNANWDMEYPATMSKNVITGILRNQLGFDGVVISDDMNMGAITDEFGLEEAIYRTIDAGVDILIFANNLVYDELIATKATDIILDLIAAGKISESRIDQSYQRIIELKERL